MGFHVNVPPRTNTLGASVVGGVGFALLVGCSGTGTGAPNPDAGATPRIGGVTSGGFVILEADASGCNVGEEEGDHKLAPPRAELEETLEQATAEFVVTLKESISLEDYPLPEDPERSDISAEEAEAMRAARAMRIAESQACAWKALMEIGGVYAGSFLLINAFTADMTADQAVQLSRRADVAFVELSETDTPPPGG
jgi:hypothetical protein